MSIPQRKAKPTCCQVPVNHSELPINFLVTSIFWAESQWPQAFEETPKRGCLIPHRSINRIQRAQELRCKKKKKRKLQFCFTLTSNWNDIAFNYTCRLPTIEELAIYVTYLWLIKTQIFHITLRLVQISQKHHLHSSLLWSYNFSTSRYLIC